MYNSNDMSKVISSVIGIWIMNSFHIDAVENLQPDHVTWIHKGAVSKSKLLTTDCHCIIEFNQVSLTEGLLVDSSGKYQCSD